MHLYISVCGLGYSHVNIRIIELKIKDDI
jgi:hypothetical protein